MKHDTPDRAATPPADDDSIATPLPRPLVSAVPSWRAEPARLAAGLDGVQYRPWPGEVASS